jgi:hypothetical protein
MWWHAAWAATSCCTSLQVPQLCQETQNVSTPKRLNDDLLKIASDARASQTTGSVLVHDAIEQQLLLPCRVVYAMQEAARILSKACTVTLIGLNDQKRS